MSMMELIRRDDRTRSVHSYVGGMVGCNCSAMDPRKYPKGRFYWPFCTHNRSHIPGVGNEDAFRRHSLAVEGLEFLPKPLRLYAELRGWGLTSSRALSFDPRVYRSYAEGLQTLYTAAFIPKKGSKNIDSVAASIASASAWNDVDNEFAKRFFWTPPLLFDSGPARVWAPGPATSMDATVLVQDRLNLKDPIAEKYILQLARSKLNGRSPPQW